MTDSLGADNPKPEPKCKPKSKPKHQQVDALFSMTDSLGADYVGVWANRSRFVITSVNPSGATPPVVGFFRLSVKSTAGLRNHPATSGVTTAQSPLLIGNH